jgi:hypothetical protein
MGGSRGSSTPTGWSSCGSNCKQAFETFAALHVPGDPVVLYNIWDVGSALAVVAAGAKALATGSHPVADANGWPDGQQVPIDFALANARIVDAVELPLTVDFEGAYSVDPTQAATMSRARRDRRGRLQFRGPGDRRRGPASARPAGARIAAIRRAVGDAFFINARTDLFLKTRSMTMRAGRPGDRARQGVRRCRRERLLRAAAGRPAADRAGGARGAAAAQRHRLPRRAVQRPNGPAPASRGSATAPSRTGR